MNTFATIDRKQVSNGCLRSKVHAAICALAARAWSAAGPSDYRQKCVTTDDGDGEKNIGGRMGAVKAGLENGGGIERVASTRGFDETVSHLEQLLAARGMILFAKIDFTGDAKRAGLTMPRMMLLVFGNPKGGTPVMVAAPSSALDLPLKVLSPKGQMKKFG